MARASLYTYEITWAKHGDRAGEAPMLFEGVDYQVGDGLHKIYVQSLDGPTYQLGLSLRLSDVQMIRIVESQS